MRRKFLLPAVLLVSSSAFATELITNGSFEAGNTGWTLGGLAAIGDWSGTEIRTGTGVFGPPTKTCWLGGYDSANDTASQSFTSLAGHTALLSFDLYWVNVDVSGFDFFKVYVDRTLLDTKDLGDFNAIALLGPSHLSYDVTSFMDGGAHTLKFQGITDASFASSAFVDNASIDASVVPEPATLAALGLGAALLLRRRK